MNLVSILIIYSLHKHENGRSVIVLITYVSNLNLDLKKKC